MGESTASSTRSTTISALLLATCRYDGFASFPAALALESESFFWAACTAVGVDDFSFQGELQTSQRNECYGFCKGCRPLAFLAAQQAVF